MRMIRQTLQKKNNREAAAHNREHRGISLQDNRNQYLPSVISGINTGITNPQSTLSGVVQAKWKDNTGKEHEGDPPPGWIKGNNTLIGEYWEAPATYSSDEGEYSSADENEKEEKKEKNEKKGYSSEDSSGDSSVDEDGYASEDGDTDFVFDEEQYQKEISNPEEKLRAKGGAYRKSRKFYRDKERDTRKNLTKRQTGKDGKLRSGFNGDGPVIVLDKKGREVRKHKTEGAKDRQPDIDHKRDWVVVDDETDNYAYEESSMSDTDLETFKDELYNDEDNLEILSHNEHKNKKRTTRDQITDKERKEARDYVRKKRGEYKKDDKAQKRRSERSKRKRKREQKQKDQEPRKRSKKGKDDSDSEN